LDSVEVVTDTIMPHIHCLEWNHVESLWPDSVFVIRNDSVYSELKKLKATIGGCPNWEFPSIDFNKYTLLGRLIRTGGLAPGPEFIRSVTKYNFSKKCIYLIQLTRYQNKDIIFGRGFSTYNWVLVPNIPSDYEIHVDTTFKLIIVD